jgi:uncharacterized protein YecE (DUF72 family)
MYAGCYPDEELSNWAKRIAGLSRGLKALYGYFNSELEGSAARNAAKLAQLLAEVS